MDETALLRQERNGAPDQYAVEQHIQQQNKPPVPQYQQPQAPYMQQQQQQQHMRQESIDRKRSGSDASAIGPDIAPPQKYETYGTPVQNHSAYHPPPPPPSGPAPSANSNQHLAFGGSSHPPPPAPPHHIHPPQIHQDMYQSRYASQPQAPPPTQQRPQHPYPGSNGNGYQSFKTEPSQQQPMQQQPPSRRPSIEDFTRRGSDSGFHHSQQQQQQQYGRPSTPSVADYSTQPHTAYSHSQYAPPPPQQQQPAHYSQPTQQSQQTNSLPPLRNLPAIMEPKLGWSGQPTTPSSTTATAQLPKPYTSTAQPPQQRPAAPIAPASSFPTYYPSPQPPQQTPAYTPQAQEKKRPWGRVFNPTHTEGPLHNGMRPDTTTQVYGGDSNFAADPVEEDDGYDVGHMRMSYRRADGLEIVRDIPGYA